FLEHDSQHETIGSISNERTFSMDIGNRDAVKKQLLALCERVCWRARKRDIRARTVSLKLRYSDFETLTRSRTLSQPANDEQRVYGYVLHLLKTAWTRELPIRLVGVSLSNLEGPSSQLAFAFAEEHQRSIGTAIDAVRSRFGYNAIRLGATGESRWLEQKEESPEVAEAEGEENGEHESDSLLRGDD
ncbi:MAG: hypothetical protein GY906_17760, partial [bacterium]|nr:hypothetical protein [bacterium]